MTNLHQEIGQDQEDQMEQQHAAWKDWDLTSNLLWHSEKEKQLAGMAVHEKVFPKKLLNKYTKTTANNSILLTL